MLELLKTGLDFLLGLLTVARDLVVVSGDFLWGLLYTLHVETPRLEGLLLGVALAWLLGRRDKHPLLRALSAPLKLVLDILDLFWDQCVEVVTDVWGVAMSWVKGSWGWCWGKVTGAGGWVMARLQGLKSRLGGKAD